MRRRAHRERLEQEAELLALLLGTDAEVVEDLLLQPRLVNPERAAGELDPVRDEVIGNGARAAGVRLEDLDAVVRRTGERMVRGDPALCIFVPLRRGHVDDPQELPERLVDQVELPPELQAQQAQHLRGDARVIRYEEQGVPGLAPLLEQLGREELRDRRAHLAVRAEDDVRKAFRPPRLRVVLECLHLGA